MRLPRRLLGDCPRYADPEKRWERAMRWHKALFEAEWVGIYWPKEYDFTMVRFARKVLGQDAQLVEGAPFAVEHGRWMHSFF